MLPWLELFLLITAVAGTSLSLAMTYDSWIRYLRVKDILTDNRFPRMQLRTDTTILVSQMLLATLSLVWFTHLHQSEPRVIASLEHLWVVFPIRFACVAVLTGAQLWNAWDRHAMHFGDATHPKCMVEDCPMGARRETS